MLTNEIHQCNQRAFTYKFQTLWKASNKNLFIHFLLFFLRFKIRHTTLHMVYVCAVNIKEKNKTQITFQPISSKYITHNCLVL